MHNTNRIEIRTMSEGNKEQVTDKKVSRRSMLKWTGALAAAVAVGVGAGYETNQILRPLTTMTTTELHPVVYEEQVYTSMLGDGSGGPCTPAWVHVKNGKIIRVRPIQMTEDEAKPWKFSARGKVFEPPKRLTIDPLYQSFRRWVYSPKRVNYPLKRVGFTPGPQTASSIDNRGKGEFIRISWDEALDTIKNELTRMKATYGSSAILLLDDGHMQPGNIHRPHWQIPFLLRYVDGCSFSVRNPDSWEGWCWGAAHAWGYDQGYGQEDQTDLLEDTFQNTELLICFGDGETTIYGFNAQDPSIRHIWTKQLGIKKIFITPDLNQEAGLHGNKWIPVRPGTDAAWAAAVANVWIKEGTYNKDYVNTHGYGFDKWSAYVTGAEDGVPKTPEWAEPITGIKARIIRALAREWASKTTSTECGGSSAACRAPYAHEWTRMIVYLLTMQGWGRPGVNYFTASGGLPKNPTLKGIPARFPTAPYRNPPPPPASYLVRQFVYKDKVPDAILNPPVSWYGSYMTPSRQDELGPINTFPKPGMSEAHMIWTSTASHVTNWNCGNKFAQAFRSPKIEFILSQHPWLESDVLFADIVLPGSSCMERDDIIQRTGGNHDVAVYMKKCIEPLGESKSDYETLCAIADKLGLLNTYTEGKTVEDWIKFCFNGSSLPNFISYEDFKAKGYYVFKFPDTWPRNPGAQWYYNKPVGDSLGTPSGKVEFYSQGLANSFPDDKERPPVAHYIPSGETHQESLSTPRAQTYPLLCESSHPKWRWHSKFGNVSWLHEIPGHFGAKMKVGDYYYECLGMNPNDAAARGIKHGDIVRAYNERGAVLFAAFVTERLMPGVVSASEGSNYDPIEVGVFDKGGCINTIAPSNTLSKNTTGMTCNAFLVQVEKLAGPVPQSIAEKAAGK